jgi:hypothetical protein
MAPYGSVGPAQPSPTAASPEPSVAYQASCACHTDVVARENCGLDVTRTANVPRAVSSHLRHMWALAVQPGRPQPYQ